MRIAIWKTGHEIADTVAQSLEEGFDEKARILSYDCSEWCSKIDESTDCHIAYGILRGTRNIFKQSGKPWFNIDRGYFNPSHFDGYYRISHKGTQVKYDRAFPITKEFEGKLEPVRKYDKSKPVLVCPPTDAVCYFFGFKWWNPEKIEQKFIIRPKGDPKPINWNEISAVMTFNSSLGWEALKRGIPCLSDTQHSVVGSYYNTKSIDEAIEMINTRPRKPLFDFMRSHQFTLAEISRGDAWDLINHYACMSDGTHARQSAQMSVPTLSASALKHHFQSNT